MWNPVRYLWISRQITWLSGQIQWLSGQITWLSGHILWISGQIPSKSDHIRFEPYYIPYWQIGLAASTKHRPRRSSDQTRRKNVHLHTQNDQPEPKQHPVPPITQETNNNKYSLTPIPTQRQTARSTKVQPHWKASKREYDKCII